VDDDELGKLHSLI